MYIKIYFNDSLLFLTDTDGAETDVYRDQPGTFTRVGLTPENTKAVIEAMRSGSFTAGIYKHEDFQKLRDTFSKEFKLLQTGGGLVQNDDEEYLFIFRRGKWDPPKGKLDDGETIEECALREINEETGLVNLAIKKHLINTYHTYDEKGKHILKENCWYLVHAAGNQRPSPQLEEQITELRWARKGNLGQFLGNTMPSIVDVLRAGGLADQTDQTDQTDDENRP